MRYAIPQCPECGEFATGVYENILGTALMSVDEDTGEFDFSGETDVSWDSQESVTNDKGEVELTCGGHSWWSAELPDDAVQVIAERWTSSNSDEAQKEGWFISFTDEHGTEGGAITKDDDSEEFKSHAAALRFVKARAKRESELHQKALRICGVSS